MADEFDQYKANPDEFDQYKVKPQALGVSPIGMANRALELASPGRGMQVSGHEMMPQHHPTAQALRSGKAGMPAPVAGALSAGLDIAKPYEESFKDPQPIPLSKALDPLAGALPAAIQTVQYVGGLPQKIGEHIGESVNAFRNDEPIEGWQHAYEGAGDVAQLVPAVRPLAAGVPPLIRGGARTLNAGIRNASPILGGIGGLTGLIEGAERGRPIGGLMGGTWGAYGGTRLGKYIQKIPPVSETFGLPKPEYYDKSVLPEQAAPLRGVPSGPPAGVGPAVTTEAPPLNYSETAGKRTITPQNPVPIESSQPRSVPFEEQPMSQTAAQPPTPQELAKSLGYKSPSQAIGKLGPAQWNELLNNVSNAPVTAIGGRPVAPNVPAQVAPPMAEAAPPQSFPAIDFRASTPRELPDLATPQWRWRETQEDLALRDKMEREYGTDMAPVTKPEFFRRSDNAVVTREWANEHPNEFYTKDVPYEYADTLESQGMQANQPMFPTSRAGRAMQLEQNRWNTVRNNISTPKGVLGDITWPKQ